MIDRGAGLALRMLADEERRRREYRLRAAEEESARIDALIKAERERKERQRLTAEAAARRRRIAEYEAKRAASQAPRRVKVERRAFDENGRLYPAEWVDLS